MPNKKGKPSPRRKVSEAKLKVSSRSPGASREAKRALIDQARKIRMELRVGYMRGEESALPNRDRGAVRRFVRTYINERRSVTAYFLMITMLVIFLASTMIYAAFFQSGKGNFFSKPSFIMTVPIADVSIVLSTPGAVINTNDFQLTPTVREPISSINVKVGDRVTKGQVLGTLNDTMQLRDLASAKYSLTSSKAYAAISNPQPNLETAIAALESSQANYNYALDQLNQTKLISPIDGVISVINGAVGEYPLPDYYQQVGGRHPMFIVSSNIPPQFQSIVDISDGSKLFVGKMVSVFLNLPKPQTQQQGNVQPSASASPSATPAASPSPTVAALVPTTFSGIINSLTPIPPAVGVKPGIQVNVDFNQKIPNINPGLSGVLKSVVIAASKVVAIPNEAIHPYGGLYRVNVVSYVSGKKIITPKLVTLGVVGDTSTEVLVGVKAGDKIEISYK
jgi:multidrug efflux pump subunit AcrA (membrane-fusion protein)